jgi:hypothetical protein
VDEKNQSVPFATVTDVKHNLTLGLTDTSGNISVAADSSINVIINAKGYQPRQTLLEPRDSTTTVVLPRSESALSDVVVTANAKSRSPSRVRLEAVQPLEGRGHFEAYVAENMEWSEEWNKDRKGEEAALSFDIDKQGNAINITIDRSVCAACDSLAIRLIRDGAKWQKTKKSTKAKAYIRF